jgi:hypothetical protein
VEDDEWRVSEFNLQMKGTYLLDREATLVLFSSQQAQAPRFVIDSGKVSINFDGQ